MTEGRRLLDAALRHVSMRELARRLNVSHTAVEFWAAGDRTPAYAARVALQRELGITLDAWDRRAEEIDAVATPVATLHGTNRTCRPAPSAARE